MNLPENLMDTDCHGPMQFKLFSQALFSAVPTILGMTKISALSIIDLKAVSSLFTAVSQKSQPQRTFLKKLYLHKQCAKDLTKTPTTTNPNSNIVPKGLD